MVLIPSIILMNSRLWTTLCIKCELPAGKMSINRVLKRLINRAYFYFLLQAIEANIKVCDKTLYFCIIFEL